MAETDTNDLSIDEILASIRNILQETNGETASAPIDDDVFELSPEMILGGKPEDEPVAVANIAPADEKPAVEQEVLPEQPLTAPAEGPVCKTAVILTPEPEAKICEPTVLARPESPVARQETAGRMIKSFARLFEEKTAPAATAVNNADAGRLLEEIVKNAVADKINDCLLNAAVKEKIVPVLDSWLKLYLPEIVRQEVERVMAKVGKR